MPRGQPRDGRDPRRRARQRGKGSGGVQNELTIVSCRRAETRAKLTGLEHSAGSAGSALDSRPLPGPSLQWPLRSTARSSSNHGRPAFRRPITSRSSSAACRSPVRGNCSSATSTFRSIRRCAAGSARSPTTRSRSAIGDVMRAYAAGRVEASSDSRFQEGEYVTGQFGWQDYAVVDPAMVIRQVVERDLPLSTALGVLGTNGLTAYFGLLESASPRRARRSWSRRQPGRSARASGRSRKIKGCRAVGIAGGAEKCRVVPRRISTMMRPSTTRPGGSRPTSPRRRPTASTSTSTTRRDRRATRCSRG